MVTAPIWLFPGLGYWKATESPLSADVGIVETDRQFWLFDVGNAPETAAAIQNLSKPYQVVLSHFHQDHIGSLPLLSWKEIYQGAYTYRHTGTGKIVDAPLQLTKDPELLVFPLPSSHAKDSLALMIDQTYSFLGDGIYSCVKNKKCAYNITLLREEIQALKALPSRYFLLSHDEAFLHEKNEIIEQLEQLYSRRIPGEPFLFLEPDSV